MRPLLRVLSFVMLLGTPSGASELEWPPPADPAEPPPRLSLSLSSRAGLVEAPFVTAAFPEVSGFATVMTGAAAVRLSRWGLRLRWPVAIVGLDFPAGAQVAVATPGNLELGVEHRWELKPATRSTLLAAAILPTAQHGSPAALLDNRALALASALNGGQDAALLTPGIAGLRLSAGIEHSLPPFELRARVELPVVARVSAASLPAETETHALGLQPTLDVGATYWVASWLAASLDAALVTELMRVQEPALERARTQRLQPLLSPGLVSRLGRHAALGLDACLPIGGALGGDAWSVALRGQLSF